jgi:hypothetical protein
LGPELGTAQENDAEQGSSRWTIAPRVCGRSRCKYLPIPNGRNSRMAIDTTTKSLEAHSTGQGGIANVLAIMRHSRAVRHACPTSNHCYQVEGSTEAGEKLVGPRRSAQDSKKGHRSVSHDNSVLFPTRVLAQPLSHMNAINSRNSLCDPAPVCSRIKLLLQYCLTKTRWLWEWTKTSLTQNWTSQYSPVQPKTHHNDAAHFMPWI